MGSGTAEEARDWVEYCNGAAGSRWADLRVANGHPKSYGVRLWALGNEISAAWELGYTETPDEYIAGAREFARAMKAVDPSIHLVIAGAHFPIGFPQRTWSREVLAGLYEYADFMSMHHYIGHDYQDEIVDSWQGMGSVAVHRHLSEYMRLLDDTFRITTEDIRLINHERGMNRPVGIALDEYNPWYRTARGEDRHRELMTLADSLLVGSYFNIFLRHAERVTLANMAQLVNTILAMVTETGGEGFYRQASSWIQELFLRNKGGTSVDTFVDGPGFPGSYFSEVPYLDVSATRHGDRLVLNVINRDCENGHEFDFHVVGWNATAVVARSISGELDDHNDFVTPEAVGIRGLAAPASGRIAIARSSVTVFEFAISPCSSSARSR